MPLHNKMTPLNFLSTKFLPLSHFFFNIQTFQQNTMRHLEFKDHIILANITENKGKTSKMK